MNENVEVAYLPIWRRYADHFRQNGLSDSQKGKLLGFMMDYQFEGKEPETVPRALTFAWPYIKKDLDDARRQYETSVRNGRKGGRPKKKTCEEPEKNPETTQGETYENLEKGNTSTNTNTRSMSYTNANTDTGSAPACVEAGVSVAKYSFGEFGWVKLTRSQYEDLERRMGATELRKCITYIDESAQTTGNRNRWKDWYLLLRRCHEQRWYEIRGSRKNDIPTGASGELGEAELEAIRRVLSEGKSEMDVEYEYEI